MSVSKKFSKCSFNEVWKGKPFPFVDGVEGMKIDAPFLMIMAIWIHVMLHYVFQQPQGLGKLSSIGNVMFKSRPLC